MLFKKTFSKKIVNGVQLGNGTVSFQNVKLNVHCFFLDGVLIDTGSQSLEKEFTPFFKQLDIDQVVITHHHEDHTGCASFLQKELNVPLYMNDRMIEYCQNKPNYPLYRKVFWGKRKPFEANPIGETFHSLNAIWDVIDSPGHAKDHVAFFNRETGQLFTGDLFCQPRTKVVLRDEHIPTIIESLKKVLTFDFDDVFCSHAGYLKNGRTSLERKVTYLEDLQRKIIELHDKGLSAQEITTTLFPKKYPITRFSFGEWSSNHIVYSVLKEYREHSFTA